MTPWIDTEKIRVGPIDPEQRKAIDAQLVRLIAQHRIVAAGEAANAVAPAEAHGAVTRAEAQGQVQS